LLPGSPQATGSDSPEYELPLGVHDKFKCYKLLYKPIHLAH